MRFVVDETCWSFDGLSGASCVGILEDILDQIDLAIEYQQPVCFSDELFTRVVRDESTFYDLYAQDSPVQIPFEVRERIAAIFGRLPTWQELNLDWPDSFEVSIDGGDFELAPSIAWAHKQGQLGPERSVACFVHVTRRRGGQFDVSVDNKSAPIWFVSSRAEFQGFFRWLIRRGTKNHHELSKLCAPAFHQLEFIDGAVDGIKSMSKPYMNVIDKIVEHLSAFSDHGQRIFGQPWSRAAAEFGSVGIDISDENGATKSNRVARTERTRRYQGQEMIFWWHSKLEPHQDRIHICPDNVKNGGVVVVGIFCNHLTT